MKSLLTRDNAFKAAAVLNPGWTLRQWALGGAWFFALASLFPLLWVASEGSAGRVFGVTDSAGVDHGVFLLTYSGFLGATVLWTEIIALIGAIVFTVLPIRRARKIGHGYLIAWSAWWTLGTAYLAAYSPVAFGIQSLLLAGLFACTVYRATDALRRRHPAEASSNDPDVEEAFDLRQATIAPRAERIEIVEPVPAPVALAVPAAPLVAAEREVDPIAPTIDVEPSWPRRARDAARAAARVVRDAVQRTRAQVIPSARRFAGRAWRRLRDGYRSTATDSSIRSVRTSA